MISGFQQSSFLKIVSMQTSNSIKPISVLLIEDSTPDARYVREMLPAPSYCHTHKMSLEQAQACDPKSFDVLLLDLSLPDGDGLESFLAMLSWGPLLPIVILTGLDDETIAIQAVHLGAQDYILKKEISEHILSRTIRYAIERKEFQENAKRLAVFDKQEEFMATLTHDLKNPLIGANRILELMADQVMGAISPKQATLLLQLRDSNTLLLSMIQNLIEVYRFERDVDTVLLEDTNLLPIANSCITEITSIAENRAIRLVANLPSDINTVLADANCMRRVIQNLLDNALKFTPDGGQISLTLSSRDKSVILEVEDNGPGIPADEKARLFQRFSQGCVGRRYTRGTGLGLFLCKQIVDAHHGEIICESKEGVGSTFRVTLPVANFVNNAGNDESSFKIGTPLCA
jgi:signal transduction histidine kinase